MARGSFLSIKSNWQQFEEEWLYKNCLPEHYLLHPLEKKLKYKVGKQLHVSEGGFGFVFTFKICKNFTLKEKSELTRTCIY